ncbi:MAG: cation transporter [Anaerolineales bacterium]|nr:MAG: cation transporter [Anaerolineales bacterium]
MLSCCGSAPDWRRIPLTLDRVRHEHPDPARRRLYSRAILIACVGNILLAGAKGAGAWLSGSTAVLSDAMNSLSDALYSLLMAAGLRLAQQPADDSHPQGHSRFEPVVGLLVALAMGGAGFAAMREGVMRFASGAGEITPGWPTIVLLGSAIVKLVMYVDVRRIGLAAGSPAIRATARDNLADVVTSMTALLGVWASRLIHPLLDPAAAIAVSLWVFRAAWAVGYENLGYLTGKGAPPDLITKIAAVASSVDGVINVHQVVADHVGPQLRVDMHVDVDPGILLREAHAITDRVQAQLETLPEVDLAFVHVEPAH